MEHTISKAVWLVVTVLITVAVILSRITWLAYALPFIVIVLWPVTVLAVGLLYDRGSRTSNLTAVEQVRNLVLSVIDHPGLPDNERPRERRYLVPSLLRPSQVLNRRPIEHPLYPRVLQLLKELISDSDDSFDVGKVAKRRTELLELAELAREELPRTDERQG